MEHFKLTIITPLEQYFEGDAISVVAPGKDGYLEILAHHAPIIVYLKPGKLTVKSKEGKELNFAVSGGFLEVSHNQANLVADAGEHINSIDFERAKLAYKRAKVRLEDPAAHIDTDRALRALERAKNRMELKGGHGNTG
ncbi:MAG: ATP synthase F1 subunit epsilon [Parachlamydia sp.]|jgi:F-type H+-transporting ATPase subunit epsilon|nr:ATP synthase F1 subunit epsilon [Parachlamydia sp.]